MSSVTLSSKAQFLRYRLSTITQSIKSLYQLKPEQVARFVRSYGVYDYDYEDKNAIIAEFGKDFYPQMKQEVINYYSVLNLLCSIGQVEKMYIPPAIDPTKSVLANQKLYEQKVAKDLRLKKGDKALDIGCGRGRVAAHIATYSGAHVTGINIDEVQLAHANAYAKGKGLTEQCQYRLADLNDLPLPFADNSLDGVYEVQVFTYSTDLLKLFKDIYRVLKPGARFAALDWFHLDAYDPKDPHHADLMKRVKPLIGAIGTRSPRQFVDLLKQAGFEIIEDHNPSVDGLQAGLINKADQFFTKLTRWIKVLSKFKVVPQYFNDLFERLTRDGQAFVESDRMRIMTSCHYILAEKKK